MKLLRKQFYAGSYPLISCGIFSCSITSFKRGRKTSVSSRTQQSFKQQDRVVAPERALQGLSLQKVGIWRNHRPDRMGNTGSTCWSCWGSCCCVGVLGPVFMVSSPSDSLHYLWKIIPLSIPKFPRCKIGGLTISLLAILCHYTRQRLFDSACVVSNLRVLQSPWVLL